MDARWLRVSGNAGLDGAGVDGSWRALSARTGRSTLEALEDQAADVNRLVHSRRHDRVELDRLTGYDNAVVREQLDTNAVREEQRILELRLLQSQRVRLCAQRAYFRESSQERLRNAGLIGSIEGSLRAFDGLLHGVRPCLDAIEERRFGFFQLTRYHRFDELVPGGGAARQRDQLAEPLTLVHRTGQAPDLGVRTAEKRIVRFEIDRHELLRGVGRLLVAEAKWTHEVELGRLPRVKPVAELIGEVRRIGRGAEGLARELRRCLVVLPSAGPVRSKPDDHVGSGHPDEAHEIIENLLPAPTLERLLDAERVAEIDRPREELLGAVEAVSREQFLRPERRQGIEELRADLVLTAVPSRRRRQHGPNTEAAAHHREQRIALVVRMRRRHHERAGCGQSAEGQAQADAAGLEVRSRLKRREGNGRQQEKRERRRPDAHAL